MSSKSWGRSGHHTKATSWKGGCREA